MSLIEQAISDIKAITSNTNEFAQSVTLSSRKFGNEVTVAGIVNKININVDSDGNPIHSKNPTLAISEEVLVDAGYPVRNSDEEVDMLGDIVKTKDSSGVQKLYQISSKMPDETVGLLVFTLEDYEENA